MESSVHLQTLFLIYHFLLQKLENSSATECDCKAKQNEKHKKLKKLPSYLQRIIIAQICITVKPTKLLAQFERLVAEKTLMNQLLTYLL